MTALDLAELRLRLEARRRRLLDRMWSAHERAHEAIEEKEPEDAESALQQVDAAALYDQGADDADSILAIDAALRRLAAGAYGRCEVCGAAIAPDRLAALPHTTRCRDHAEPTPAG
jgi:RNA polymerase-binding transcription factor DksA